MDRSDLIYIRKLENKINAGLERIAFLKSKAFPGAIRYDSTGGNAPTVFDSLGVLYAKIDQEERRVDRLIDQQAALKQQAARAIRQQVEDPRARHIMYLRYLAMMEWQQVDKIVGKHHKINRRRIFDLHHDALIKLKLYKI